MAFMVSESSGSKFPPIEQGTHQAVCFGLVDIGTHFNQAFGKSNREAVILWELPEERITIKDKDVPRTISKTYTISLAEKANLHKDLVSWRGKTFSNQELEGFDLKNILGVNAMIQVIHKTSGNRTYSNVSAILPLLKGMKAKVAETPILYFSFSDTNSIPETIPGWIKEKILSSDEWKLMEEQGSHTETYSGPAREDNDEDSDVPF